MIKKILNRKDFDLLREKNSNKMFKDKNVFNKSLNLIQKADEYMFIHQNNFLGEPSINFADDLMKFQEVIYKTKPEMVIEIGVAWGGTTLFLASILESLGRGKVIGIDTYIPNHVRKNILKKGKLSKRIELIKGSSLDERVFKLVKKYKGKKKCIIILDSNHTEKHVMAELDLYSKLINKGNYLIVCDTIVNFIKPNKFRKRPWNKKNNPLTAINKFLKINKSFIIDKSIDKRLLLSCNYNGFLKKI